MLEEFFSAVWLFAASVDVTTSGGLIYARMLTTLFEGDGANAYPTRTPIKPRPMHCRTLAVNDDVDKRRKDSLKIDRRSKGGVKRLYNLGKSSLKWKRNTGGNDRQQCVAGREQEERCQWIALGVKCIKNLRSKCAGVCRYVDKLL